MSAQGSSGNWPLLRLMCQLVPQAVLLPSSVELGVFLNPQPKGPTKGMLRLVKRAAEEQLTGAEQFLSKLNSWEGYSWGTLTPYEVEPNGSAQPHLSSSAGNPEGEAGKTNQTRTSGGEPHLGKVPFHQRGEQPQTSLGDRPYILSIYTVIAKGNRVLPKPGSAKELEVFLRTVQGGKHKVITAMCLAPLGGRTSRALVCTKVALKRLSSAQIKNYVVSQESLGGDHYYDTQGLLAPVVRRVNGSVSNLYGLPALEVVNLLQGRGLKLSFN